MTAVNPALAAAIAAQGVPLSADLARLSPEREAEITARTEAATKGPWGLYDDGTGLIDVAADLEDTGHGYRCRRYVGQLEDNQIDNDPSHRDWTEEQDRAQSAADAEFIAHAREDVPVLLAELAAVRKERDEARESVDFLERNTLPDLRRQIQHHEDGKKRWRDRAREAEAMVRELKRPAELKRRNEIRSSYTELISQAEQDRDHEGAAELAQLLDDAESKWQREDEEAAR